MIPIIIPLLVTTQKTMNTTTAKQNTSFCFPPTLIFPFPLLLPTLHNKTHRTHSDT